MSYDLPSKSVTPSTVLRPDMASLDPKATVGEQPMRPLSAYNVFFQICRKRILETSSDNPNTGPYTRAEVYSICLDKTTRLEKSKRPHRKMHGMISFTMLAKTIAEQWKALEEDQKRLFEERADEMKKKYAIELEEWLLKQTPTPQIKKRLGALRRGSLGRFISSKRKTPPSPSPSPSRLPPSSHVRSFMSPDNSVAPKPSTPGEPFPSRQLIQLRRARNLQRLYQMQIQLYNEQMRLHAECNGDMSPTPTTNTPYDSTPYHHEYSHDDGFHHDTPEFGCYETSRFASNSRLSWDQQPAAAEPLYMDHLTPLRRSHSRGFDLPMPVQSPFHDHVDGRVSPYEAGHDILA